MTHYGIVPTSIRPNLIFHGSDGSPAVTVRPDGSVEISKPLPQASKVFWEAVKDVGVTLSADLAAAQEEVARLRAALEGTRILLRQGCPRMAEENIEAALK